LSIFFDIATTCEIISSLAVVNQTRQSVVPKLKGEQVSTKNNIIFQLAEADHYYGYSLKVADNESGCLVQDNLVSCFTSPLSLEQGAPYTFQLIQSLGNSKQALFEKQLTTITSVEVASSSITEGQVVFDTPSSATITMSKPLTRINGMRLVLIESGTEEAEIPTTSTIKDSTVTIYWTEVLKRQKNFRLEIPDVTAADGGFLENPVRLSFSTSGGPKVVTSTLASYKVSPSLDVSLTFDQVVQPGQSLGDIITVTSNGQNVPLTFALEGSSLRIRSKTQLDACANLTLAIKDTLVSSFGITGGTTYSASSRTMCQKQFSIGTSVEGRSIMAHSFGNGPAKYLFMSNLHGDEKSGYYILSSWIDYLESHPEEVPAGKTIVVIPHLNPDGFVHNTRFNAHNVDLNRNFPSASWKSDVKLLGGSILVNGGGSAPLSEPESKAIKDYIERLSPTLVMSYHSQGSLVIANGSGNSNAIASMYAAAVDYRHVPTEESIGTFEYDTTGALEDWLHETPDIPTVLLELSSHNNTGLFTYHKAPMLKLLK
jgi:predicted deacylase